MANSDNDDQTKDTLISKTIEFKKKAIKQLLISLVALFSMVLIFVAGLISMVNAHKATSNIIAEKPENVLEVFSKKIEKTKIKAKSQYAQYLDKMEGEGILTVNKKFRIMYELSEQSERDYVKLLEIHQKISYEIASRVRGSGEWYFYYEQKNKKLLGSAKLREKKMISYFQSE